MAEYQIYLVRHGQTLLNTFHRLQGWCDSELTELGKSQAQKTGAGIRNIDFNLVVSSDLHRAIQTRNLIVKQLTKQPQKITKDDSFREVFFSSFEGLPADIVYNHLCKKYGYASQDDIIAHDGFARVRKLMKDMDPIHKAEEYPEIIQRFSSGLYHISQQLPSGGNVLVISHGAFIRTVADYLGVNIINSFPGNASVTELQMTLPSDIHLVEYNKQI